jgi:SET domain-containing protein
LLDQWMPSGRHAKKSAIRKRSRDPDARGPWNEDELKPLGKDEWRGYRIDSAVKGNWSRYLNHSCDSNTVFVDLVLVGKFVTAIKAVRDITFGEMLMVPTVSLQPKISFLCVISATNFL